MADWGHSRRDDFAFVLLIFGTVGIPLVTLTAAHILQAVDLLWMIPCAATIIIVAVCCLLLFLDDRKTFLAALHLSPGEEDISKEEE